MRCLRSNPIAIDVPRALEQHTAYARALRDCGLAVRVLPPEPDLPDACFVEDTAVVVEDRIVLTRPGAPSRLPEIESIRSALRGESIEEGRLDGGDVLVVGRTAYVGLSDRTDERGAKSLERLGIHVRRVPVRGLLHLKTGVTPVGPRTLLQLRGAFPRGTFEGLDVLQTEEPLGANVLAIGEQVIVSASAPRTADLLRDRGLRVHSVDLSEFHAGDAGVTCLSLILPEELLRCRP
jgi:dimethylargininase